MDMKSRASVAAFLIFTCFPAIALQNGAALYSQYCAQCHDTGRVPIILITVGISYWTPVGR